MRYTLLINLKTQIAGIIRRFFKGYKYTQYQYCTVDINTGVCETFDWIQLADLNERMYNATYLKDFESLEECLYQLGYFMRGEKLI